ncbi:hypothetical protein [Vibrio harveyi]|uniref:hypothetical protein n=1 Tax=Vibrio harveyi TaxID=669 RepID=UPI0025B1A6F6|nr:hypothetical protein [Vibrio harveyi]WJT09266.1 hypothetical protein PH545_24885 [Vibrio harveyi]
MATTIQITEDIEVGRFIDIAGQRCEVEAISFSPAITEKNAQEEVLKSLTERLLEEQVIEVDHMGQLFWKESGTPVVSDEPWDDEDDE